MEILGNLALVVGTVGMVIYLCLITVRFASKASVLKATTVTVEERLARAANALAALQQQRAAIDPAVDALLGRMIDLRETRDRLSLQYQEMVARSREREINIGFRAR